MLEYRTFKTDVKVIDVNVTDDKVTVLRVPYVKAAELRFKLNNIIVHMSE